MCSPMPTSTTMPSSPTMLRRRPKNSASRDMIDQPERTAAEDDRHDVPFSSPQADEGLPALLPSRAERDAPAKFLEQQNARQALRIAGRNSLPVTAAVWAGASASSRHRRLCPR